MSTRSQAPTPVLLRVALVGLAAGAAGSSLMGARLLAGYTAVGLAVGVGLTIYSLGMGRVLPVLGGGLAITYPLAAVEQGEGGILWAAALTLMALAGAFVLRGLGRGVVGSLALCTSVVLHLGLLGSYLVLIAVSGNRLLAALVLMVTAFEVAYGFVAARAPDPVTAGAAVKGKQTGSGSRHRPRPSIVNPKASLAGIAACGAAAQLSRLFLPSALGIVGSLTLGIAVGAAATLGHAAAAITSEDLESGPEGVVLDPGVSTSLNALLFAAGAFYYGFRLYLT